MEITHVQVKIGDRTFPTVPVWKIFGDPHWLEVAQHKRKPYWCREADISIIKFLFGDDLMEKELWGWK